jgi:hypothetical protein
MRATLVDSNVILDIVTDDPVWAEWSGSALAQSLNQGIVVINPIMYAEVSIGFDRIEDLDRVLPETMIRREPLPLHRRIPCKQGLHALSPPRRRPRRGDAPDPRHPATADPRSASPRLCGSGAIQDQQPASRAHASATNSLNRASLDRESRPRIRRSLSRALTLSRIAARPGAFSHGHHSDHHPSPGGPPSHTSQIDGRNGAKSGDLTHETEACSSLAAS